MKRRPGRPWCRKNRTPNQGHKRQRKKGVCVHSKTPEQKKAANQADWQPTTVQRFLDEENFVPQEEVERKKPWGCKLKGLVKWLTVLKLIATIVNEVRKIFK